MGSIMIPKDTHIVPADYVSLAEMFDNNSKIPNFANKTITATSQTNFTNGSNTRQEEDYIVEMPYEDALYEDLTIEFDYLYAIRSSSSSGGISLSAPSLSGYVEIDGIKKFFEQENISVSGTSQSGSWSSTGKVFIFFNLAKENPIVVDGGLVPTGGVVSHYPSSIKWKKVNYIKIHINETAVSLSGSTAITQPSLTVTYGQPFYIK